MLFRTKFVCGGGADDVDKKIDEDSFKSIWHRELGERDIRTAGRSPEGAFIHDVRKIFGFFAPPPCHCYKSADLFLLSFFGGDQTADVIYGSP